MGIVYTAYDPTLDRKVAVKLLRPRVAQSALLEEAQAMARLNHPNVVAVHDVGTHDTGQVFVAMELVEGRTLRAWLEDPHPWSEIRDVFVGAGRGLGGVRTPPASPTSTSSPTTSSSPTTAAWW